jgi:hypothetical protein
MCTPMNTHPFESVIQSLLTLQKNVLILDTCCLLDIIRTPVRNQLSVLETAGIILKDIQHGANYQIVIPSLVPSEWSNNVELVTVESSRFFSRTYDEINIVKDTVSLLQIPVQLTIPDYTQLKIEEQLKDISEKIMASGLVLEESSTFYQGAHNRVLNNIPPSSKGKQSYKDCFIYEESLAIGRELFRNQFTKEIVFASSNTREYDNDGIKAELASCGMKYGVSLNHAHSIVR